MVKVVGTKQEIESLLYVLQCPEKNEEILLDECTSYDSCFVCCIKYYKLEVEYTN